MTETQATRDGGGAGLTVFTPRRVAALVLTLVVAAFVLQNRDTVTLSLLGVDVSAPLWVAFLATVLVGAAIGWLMAGRPARRDRKG